MYFGFRSSSRRPLGSLLKASLVGAKIVVGLRPSMVSCVILAASRAVFNVLNLSLFSSRTSKVLLPVGDCSVVEKPTSGDPEEATDGIIPDAVDKLLLSDAVGDPPLSDLSVELMDKM